MEMTQKKILIVDDDEGTLKLLDKMLTQEGYGVVSSRCGEEAISKAKKQCPNMVIMDIMLPDIDGAEAAKILRETRETQEIPIVFLSSIIDKGTENDPKVRVGDALYDALAKPFSNKELMTKIRKVLADKVRESEG